MCDLENLKNEEAMTRVGAQRHRKKNGELNPICHLLALIGAQPYYPH